MWSEWEDHRAGLYRPETDPAKQADAAGVLGDPEQFREAATEMLREWPNAAKHNLVNMWSGKRAWLGQATCCYVAGSSAADTRNAWGTLSNGQQRAANEVASQVIEAWGRGVQDAETLFAD